MSWTVKDKVCVVTGGNSGIGLSTAIGLARQGAKTVIVSRNRERGEAAVATVRDETGVTVDLVIGDLGTVATTRQLALELLSRYSELHVLVNNAGLWMPNRRLNEDGLEVTFAVNHLGPFVLTNLLLDRLVASSPARVVNVSSMGHRRGSLDFDDLQAERGYGKVKVYCDSKLCNVLFTRELARRLEGTGVTVNALHPGVVNTNLVQNAPKPLRWLFDLVAPLVLTSPEKGARTSLHVATAPELSDVSGSYFKDSRMIPPSKAAQSDEDARRLWAVSEELAGLSSPVGAA